MTCAAHCSPQKFTCAPRPMPPGLPPQITNPDRWKLITARVSLDAVKTASPANETVAVEGAAPAGIVAVACPLATVVAVADAAPAWNDSVRPARGVPSCRRKVALTVVADDVSKNSGPT